MTLLIFNFNIIAYLYIPTTQHLIDFYNTKLYI